ncbi:DUF397 domain-containing protein [Streptomyces kunmingensis]|uniref:DUF397 domain-containing protein n=1 Tax=Streptomyces kunmingensis TaxID=68225 RepID=A0ABU6CEW2_9ACTN|nr:DUF397 domain-containing protein [Streptomyces kunmingensis]MEB3962405.1 DUF397 domain-containing protein [Streptomyces kunmingensis]
MQEFRFEKSSYSTVANECVEVARNIPGVVAVRDSKTPDRAPTLRISPTGWAHFTKSLR